MDVPPTRWFKDALTQGPLKGAHLERQKFDAFLSKYYRKRGWDENGVPRKNTLKKLGLSDVAKQLNRYVSLSP
jgi:aldehyde:ferredoxin oxidoreductase